MLILPLFPLYYDWCFSAGIAGLPGLSCPCCAGDPFYLLILGDLKGTIIVVMISYQWLLYSMILHLVCCGDIKLNKILHTFDNAILWIDTNSMTSQVLYQNSTAT